MAPSTASGRSLNNGIRNPRVSRVSSEVTIVETLRAGSAGGIRGSAGHTPANDDSLKES